MYCHKLMTEINFRLQYIGLTDIDEKKHKYLWYWQNTKKVHWSEKHKLACICNVKRSYLPLQGMSEWKCAYLFESTYVRISNPWSAIPAKRKGGNWAQIIAMPQTTGTQCTFLGMEIQPLGDTQKQITNFK